MAVTISGRRTGPRAAALAVIAALGLTLGGCAARPEPTPLAAGGAINTGTFPNLNIPPPVAAAQLSAEDQAARRTGLSAAQASQASAGAGAVASPANQARLQQAQANQQATLSAITGEP